jgi:DNA mismatch repair protein MutS
VADWTPMMQQYLKIKKKYPDAILFYRMGDFYEMFFDDAALAARELELTLTGRTAGKKGRVPMAGIPYHAADSYIARLIAKGYKIAVCEQMEDPKKSKGMVKREVIRVITPGTVVDPGMLDAKKNNYLAALAGSGDACGIAFIDVTTGEFAVTEIAGSDRWEKIMDELARYQPAEIIMPEDLHRENPLPSDLRGLGSGKTVPHHAWAFGLASARSTLQEHFRTVSLAGYGCAELPQAIRAAGGALNYLQETQKVSLTHINSLTTYTVGGNMILDRATRRNLELTSTLRAGEKSGSLLWVLDQTKTAMGARRLRAWIEQPLVRTELIRERLDAVEELQLETFLRSDLREWCDKVYDLERLLSRIIYGTANARDLLACRQTLAAVPPIKELLQETQAKLLRQINENLDPLTEITTLVNDAITDEPPAGVRDGNLIRTGYNQEVDKYRQAAAGGKEWIAAFENREREKTGIKSLKVGFNRVFGYYITVTNSNKSLVPEHYQRKQTLANAERYTTEELKEYESLILGAEEKLVALEYELFDQVRQFVAAQTERIQATARNLAILDALTALAETAVRNNYVRPVISDGDKIIISGGRHPVVEKVLSGEEFVPNDTLLDNKDNAVVLITGPNMAGKSTYMRQVALIVLMAQIGSFVPAGTAEIGVVDRIFTRVGAYDDLVMGQSTFMVEMTEVANILHHATPRSLIILDEIGRGTSTYDGMSIARAVVEYIRSGEKIGAKTLFATHYHELTDLEAVLPGVVNYSVAVREKGEEIVFLRRIVRGGADRSYGIQVARLAGLPTDVVARAKEILFSLERRSDSGQVMPGPAGVREKKAVKPAAAPHQLSFLTALSHPVLERLETLDLDKITPRESLNLLYELQAIAREGVSENDE